MFGNAELQNTDVVRDVLVVDGMAPELTLVRMEWEDRHEWLQKAREGTSLFLMPERARNDHQIVLSCVAMDAVNIRLASKRLTANR